jgi:hypothetical protein
MHRKRVSVDHSNSLTAMAEVAGIPPYNELLWPTLMAVRRLGGAGKIEEIDDAVIEDEGFSEDQVAILHQDGPRSELQYRLAWARTYLRGMGVLANPSRATWTETEFGKQVEESEIEPLRHSYLKRLAEDRKSKGKAAKEAGAESFWEFCSRWTRPVSSISLVASSVPQDSSTPPSPVGREMVESMGSVFIASL